MAEWRSKMVSQKYKDMLGAKSVIRQMSEWAAGRAKEIGSENVFDFSLGNPSVAVPQAFTDKMVELLQTRDTMALHGYSQSQGIPSVRARFAEFLNQTYGMGYTAEHLFMTTGAAGAVAHAVGGAVSHNPISIIIPCHRVVGTNGSLTGYAGGIDKKVQLLTLEKADMSRLFVPKKGTAL